MSWTWQFLDPTGSELTGGAVPASAAFPTQGEAETWVGESWRDLLDAGVDAVCLFQEGRLVYGPMSLHPPQ